MQIHELTTAATLDSTDYVAVDNGAATRKYNLGTALEYKAGDSISGYFYAFGWVTNTGKDLRILIPLSKFIRADVSFSFNFETQQMRGVKSDMSGGGYAAGGGAIPSDVAVSLTSNNYNKQGIAVTLTYETGWGLANNTPIAGTIYGTITFS